MPTHDPRKAFSRNVKSLRKARGLSQEGLADAIGKSVATVSNIERGLLATRLQTAAEIADVLDVDLIELFRAAPETPIDRRRRALIDKVLAVVEDGDERSIEAIESALETIVKLRR